MRRSSNHMLPASTSQKPAIIRSSVVLPHPEGPRRVNNLPSSIVAETLSTARTAPKLRLTPSRRIVVIERRDYRYVVHSQPRALRALRHLLGEGDEGLETARRRS